MNTKVQVNAPTAQAKAEDKNNLYFDRAMLGLLLSLTLEQNLVQTAASNIEVSSQNTDVLQKQINGIPYAALPANPTQNQIDQTSVENQRYANERADLQNELLTEQQNLQQQATGANTMVQITSQDMSAAAALLSSEYGVLKYLQTTIHKMSGN